MDRESGWGRAVWRFVRGRTPPSDFEDWLFSDPALEDFFGKALYLELISANYRSHDEVDVLRGALQAQEAKFCSHKCLCSYLDDTEVVDMGQHEPVFATLQELRRRGAPYWWLSMARCSECDQSWLVGAEERQNDVFCLRKLDNEAVERVFEDDTWPSDLDTYEVMLQLGRAAGRSVTFVDPLGSLSLSSTIADLAKARPGIRLSEIAALLNLDPEVARVISRKVIDETGVQIDLNHASGRLR